MSWLHSSFSFLRPVTRQSGKPFFQDQFAPIPELELKDVAFFLIAVGSMIAYLDYLGTANLTGAGALLKQELFTDPTPFYKWLGALIIVALLGYVDDLRPISQALLILIIVSLLLSHSGVIAQIAKVT